MTNNKSMTPEQIEKAKSAPDAAALIALAQGNGITLTSQQAEELYTELHTKTDTITDKKLDEVVGGWEPEGVFTVYCPYCGCLDIVPPHFFQPKYTCSRCYENFTTPSYKYM